MGRAPVVVLTLVLGTVQPVIAQEALPVEGYHESVLLVGSGGETLRFGAERYGGRLEVRASAGGLVVVEHVAPEDYLLGIEEVPLSWPDQALRAQAVAARTYLAWTLSAGRAGAAATHGFDICATDACQVYRGVDQVRRHLGGRWADAVRATAGEILLYEGRPAQALYSSTSGGRTRAVQDVFPGSPPIPYLQPVDSPGEDSPFATWRVELTSWKLADVLREAGYLVGPDIREVELLTTPDGQGQWMVELQTGAGQQLLGISDFRRALNVYGPERHSGDLPDRRPDGQRYPQVVLSPTFSVHPDLRSPEDLRPGYPVVERVFVLEGRGWGHQVGMSQYGAQAMAEGGSPYQEILAHFYGGLLPSQAGDHLPDDVQVGLGWDLQEVTISASGPTTLVADGEELVTGALGSWTFRYEQGLVAVVPPSGFGLPPTLTHLEVVRPVREGRAVVIRGILSTPSELRLVVFRGAEVADTTEWRAQESGQVVLVWDATVEGGPAPPGVYLLMVEGRAPGGSFHVFHTFLVRDA